jgi:EAL domain-containing protein (putative c-di-GMP-specific phosphodiesterase class I)
MLLEQGRFQYYVQPQVATLDGRIVGGELLLRCDHPQRGLLGPITLLPAIEAAGLQDALPLTLLGRLLRRARGWPGRKMLSFNIEPRQLNSRGFVATLLEVLAIAGYPPEQFKLELLEAGGLDFSAAGVNAKLLESEGVDLWLDDFGSAESNAERFVHLPVKGLKIDKRSIDALSDSTKAQAAVGRTIDMALDCSMLCVAEGVETTLQARWLRDRGCPLLQGWVGWKPMPVDEYEALLMRMA